MLRQRASAHPQTIPRSVTGLHGGSATVADAIPGLARNEDPPGQRTKTIPCASGLPSAFAGEIAVSARVVGSITNP